MVLHNKILLTLIFISLLSTVSFADTEYKNYACLNSSALQTTTTTWNVTNSVNETTNVETASCPYGCDTVYNMCYDEGIFTFEALFIVCIIVIILVSLYLFNLFSKSGKGKGGEDIEETSTLNSGLKILFLLIALFFQYILFVRIGMFTELVRNTLIEKGGNDALTIATATFGLFFLVMAIFMIFFIMEIFIQYYNVKGGKKPPKYDVVSSG